MTTTKQQADGITVALWGAALGGLIGSVVTLVSVGQLRDEVRATPGIVVMDSQAYLRAPTMEEGERLKAKMELEVRKLAEKGYLVVDHKALLGWPADFEVTQ